MFKDMEKDSLYAEKKKFFLRFLKEKNIYSKYKRYIHNKNYYNVVQKGNHDWSFDEVAHKYGIYRMVSMLISWDATPEGYWYWHNLHSEFMNKYSKKFGDISDYV